MAYWENQSTSDMTINGVHSFQLSKMYQNVWPKLGNTSTCILNYSDITNMELFYKLPFILKQKSGCPKGLTGNQ
jgi:hypothetical protein